jgi:hypothetical protein
MGKIMKKAKKRAKSKTSSKRRVKSQTDKGQAADELEKIHPP